jgi:hypothetical protein
MNSRHMTLSTFVVCTLACFASGVRAISLDVVLVKSDVTVAPTATEADFYATIYNPSSATIFLNGDSAQTSSALLSVDDSPFNLNAPLSLGAGQRTGPFELFAVDLLSPSIPAGTYGGNVFSILGGSDGGAINDLADAQFSVTITASPVPLPATAWLLLSGLAAIGALTRKSRAAETSYRSS